MFCIGISVKRTLIVTIHSPYFATLDVKPSSDPWLCCCCLGLFSKTRTLISLAFPSHIISASVDWASFVENVQNALSQPEHQQWIYSRYFNIFYSIWVSRLFIHKRWIGETSSCLAWIVLTVLQSSSWLYCLLSGIKVSRNRSWENVTKWYKDDKRWNCVQFKLTLPSKLCNTLYISPFRIIDNLKHLWVSQLRQGWVHWWRYTVKFLLYFSCIWICSKDFLLMLQILPEIRQVWYQY